LGRVARASTGAVDGKASASEGKPRRDLRSFDFTLLVVGSIIGDGVFVVSGYGAQYLGPAQLLAWGAGGVLAAFIGLAFIQCAAVYPEVGGSYAYVRHAFGPNVAFVAGWALYLGELATLPVFPLAFVRYLEYFVNLDAPGAKPLVETALVLFVVGVNISGVRRGGRLNDVITLAKLVPLLAVGAAGVALIALHPHHATANLTPFAPFGFGGFGAAVVLIFWAYAGFELAVLPAGEVQNPGRTLPRGLLFGIALATFVYLLTAFAVVVALPSSVTAASPRPIADVLVAALDTLGLANGWAAGFVSAGALISIVGVCDVYMLSVARLSYALAREGAFVTPFARLHARFGTPWVGLIIHGAIAVTASQFFDISGVLGVAVFFLGICFALTAASALRLANRSPERRLHVPGLRILFVLGVASGAYLAAQASPRLMLGGGAALVLTFVIYRASRHRSTRAGSE
jgi:amino acid transporter